MFGLTALRSAIAGLVASITGLTQTVGEINTYLRERAGLDAEAPALPPPADEEPAKGRRRRASQPA